MNQNYKKLMEDLQKINNNIDNYMYYIKTYQNCINKGLLLNGVPYSDNKLTKGNDNLDAIKKNNTKNVIPDILKKM